MGYTRCIVYMYYCTAYIIALYNITIQICAQLLCGCLWAKRSTLLEFSKSLLGDCVQEGVNNITTSKVKMLHLLSKI